MAKKKMPGRPANPDPRPTPHNPADSASMDSRDSHGLSKDEALQGKK
ncbi:hypothetical protein CEB3_c22030 [Peptococcaceae bacterium CEB3]|nr:hypothetical protein CEB3_c22030 [Peptococcaceae bacterium CEB3]